MSKSRARWEFLRRAIVKKQLTCDSDCMQRFSSFNLFTLKQCNCCAYKEDKCSHNSQEQCPWFCYSCKELPESTEVWVKHQEAIIDFKDVCSFNNTGNICIWPTEEVMAYYCLVHKDKFANQTVLEVGGGSSGLAGICVSLNSNSQVIVSDGNKKCVDLLKQLVNMNITCQKNTPNLSCCLIRWDNFAHYEKYRDSCDYILCADCLFFDEHREHLAEAIQFMLKPCGTALVFAPKRGKTLHLFVDICKKRFSKVTKSDHYSTLLSFKNEHEQRINEQYDPDIHFPLLIELVK